MAKPTGGTLTALFEVSEQERQQFYERIQKRFQPQPRAEPAATEPIQDERSVEAAPANPSTVVTLPTVDSLTTVDSQTTVGKMATVDKPTTVDSLTTVPTPFTTLDGQPVNVELCKPASLVQHGHTPGEHALYMAMWNFAGPPDRRDEYRDVAIGYDKLAALVGGSKRNMQRVVEALEQKLALEVLRPEVSGLRQGKTYRIYSMAEILRRRREAGYSWVRRNRSAVKLVKPTTVDREATVDSLSTVDNLSTDDSLSTDTVDSLSTDTVDSLSTPLGITLRNNTEESSSSTSVTLEALRAYVPADDEAVARLVDACRQADPEATAEEIAHFVRLKAEQLRRRRSVENLTGLLIAAVPKCFAGSLIRDYRATRQHRAARALNELEETLAEARRILDDPEASEQERNWAGSVLAHAEE